MTPHSSLGLLALVTLTLACGSTGGSSDGGGGSGGMSAGLGTCVSSLADAGTIASADAGCNQLVNCAAEVKFQYLGAAATAPSTYGGTVADGLYALTAARVYGLASGPDVTLQVTRLKSGTAVYGAGSGGGSTATNRFTANASFTSTEATLDQTCPGTGSMSRAYAVNGDLWLDFDVSSQRTVVYEYTRVK